MSAALVFVCLGAGYLINKQLTMSQRLQESLNDVQEDASGAMQEVRRVQRTIPDADRYMDMNRQDLTPQQESFLTQQWQASRDEVQKWESVAPPPIQGVYLTFERGGI